MRHTCWPRMITLALASLAVFCAAASGQAEDHLSCSYRGVAGKWSYRLSGSLLFDPTASDAYANAAPVAGVGTFSMDKDGNVTGGGSYKSGNTLSQVSFSGTYTVDAACTGTLSLNTVIDGEDIGVLEFDQIFGDNMNEVHWIARSPELVVNVDGKRLFHN